MYIFRKLILAIAALSFAFVISSCKDPYVTPVCKVQSPKYLVAEEHFEEIEKFKPEKHHSRW